MTRLKALGILAYTVGVLVVGALCAWLMLGGDNRSCQSIQAWADRLQAQYAEELTATQHLLEIATQHTNDLYTQLSRLERGYNAAQAARDVLQQQLKHFEERTTQETLAFRDEITRLTTQLKKAEADKVQTQSALKEQRSDYIKLANKNAALERASIEELGKAHKNGEKVSKRELPPIMQAVVNMGGVPSGKQVPRPVLP